MKKNLTSLMFQIFHVGFSSVHGQLELAICASDSINHFCFVFKSDFYYFPYTDKEVRINITGNLCPYVRPEVKNGSQIEQSRQFRCLTGVSVDGKETSAEVSPAPFTGSASPKVWYI